MKAVTVAETMQEGCLLVCSACFLYKSGLLTQRWSFPHNSLGLQRQSSLLFPNLPYMALAIEFLVAECPSAFEYVILLPSGLLCSCLEAGLLCISAFLFDKSFHFCSSQSCHLLHRLPSPEVSSVCEHVFQCCLTDKLSFSYFVGKRTCKPPHYIMLQVHLCICCFCLYLSEETFHGHPEHQEINGPVK